MPTFLHAAELAKPERVRIPVGDSYVIGHLYLPADHRSTGTFPAVAVAGSLISVKEQIGGIHAAEMAKRGIVALAIDYRNYGESGGAIRQYEDPAAKAEDLAAAVGFLGNRSDCRPDGVGLLGVCTSGEPSFRRRRGTPSGPGRIRSFFRIAIRIVPRRSLGRWNIT